MNLNFIQEGQGIPFVFQHGLGANILQTKKLFGTLANLQLISVDCPGHGQSPYPTQDTPSFTYYADQVLKVLDNLNIEQFILGGLSMGAGISLNIALRYPERIKALVLLRPAWLDQPCPANLAILLEAARLMKVEHGQLRFGQQEQLQVLQKTLPAAAASIMGVFDDSQQPQIDKVLKHLVRDRPFDRLDQLKTIHLPTLLIANEDDPLHPFSIAEKIHDVLPDSTLHQVVSRYIDDTRHRKEVQNLVQGFISG